MRARIIVNLQCERHCPQCPNRFPSMQARVPLEDLSQLEGCMEVGITGGEPLLTWRRLVGLLCDLREQLAMGARIWLYTSVWSPGFSSILTDKLIDGVQFTMHAGSGRQDVRALRGIERDLLQHRPLHNRLNINVGDISQGPLPFFLADPRVWSVIRMAHFYSEEQLLERSPTGLPEGETLYILPEAL